MRQEPKGAPLRQNERQDWLAPGGKGAIELPRLCGFGGKAQAPPFWEGVVRVIDLEGHPKATRAYAWSSPIEGSDKRRFFAVLHIPPIKSPVDAVRAAIVAGHRSKA